VIVALVGQKGGVGKTTCATALAVEWHARGRRVLLVDADPQGSARTWGDVAVEQGRAAPPVVAMGAGLHKHLRDVAPDYDVVVVDCPPRHGDVMRAALMVADVAVLPCGPTALDAWALEASIALVREARELRPALRAAVAITRRDPRTALGASARATLEPFGLDVLASELGLRVTYQEAPAAGLGPTTYDPGSEAAAEVRALATELEALAAPPGAPRKRRRK
jgi:chromosome partitioning protein